MKLADGSRDHRLGQGAALGAGAGVGLVCGDRDGDRGQGVFP